MEVIPAIDLMKGLVVMLTRGDSKTAKTYSHLGNPVEVAKKWEREGASAIHIVDLDAVMGKGDNEDVIASIVREVGIPVQLGGGLRSRRRVEEMFGLGVQRVILGTMAFEEPPELLYLLRRFGRERIVVALDYVDDEVMVRGWKSGTRLTVGESLNKFINLGVGTFLLTFISKDGRLAGPDYTLLEGVAKDARARIYSAGGISSLEDLKTLKLVGVWGVVVGKALYENKFTLGEAIRMVEGGC